MSKPNLLLVSSSKSHPQGYLDHCADAMTELFAGVKSIVFVPFARPGGVSHDEYTQKVRDRFATLNIAVRGLHEFDDPVIAIQQAEGVFIGGGNTFVLLRDLYQADVIEIMRDRIKAGMPYMGTSAGSNVAGLTIGTSNDMPIAHPPTFDALAVVPFNINPHYPATDPDPTHMGETREDRIGEFHIFNQQPVVAIREDGMLRVQNDKCVLHGKRSGILFAAGQSPQVIEVGSEVKPG